MTFKMVILENVDAETASLIMKKAVEYTEDVMRSLKKQESITEAVDEDTCDQQICFTYDMKGFMTVWNEDLGHKSCCTAIEDDNIYVSLDRIHMVVENNERFLEALRFDFRKLGSMSDEEIITEYVAISIAKEILRLKGIGE